VQPEALRVATQWSAQMRAQRLEIGAPWIPSAALVKTVRQLLSGITPRASGLAMQPITREQTIGTHEKLDFFLLLG
jgi:hypothetical protein